MSKREKRLARVRQNPKNVSLQELTELLRDYGVLLHRVAGSHHFYSYTVENETRVMSIPFAKPIKVIYVKRALRVIDEIRAEIGSDESDE